MDKYKIIRDLGLQVFTKPYNNDNMLVSADDLVEILDGCERVNFPNFTMFKLLVLKKPKTLEEKIQDILDDENLDPYQVIDSIKCIVGK